MFLPTSGSAKYASPLGVYDFLKRTSLMKISNSHSKELSTTAALLADCEGLVLTLNQLNLENNYLLIVW